jgi:hypothetical protein
LFHALFALAVVILGLGGFWAMRWWGLAFAACGAIYISVFSDVAGQLGAIATMSVFFAPMVVVAGVNRSRFRWW